MNQGNRLGAATEGSSSRARVLSPDVLVTRRVILLSILCSALCLAYFYILDRTFFSSRFFSPIFQLLLTGYDAQVAWLALGVCFFAVLWNRPNPILKLVDVVASHPAASALASIVPIALGSIFVYHRISLSMDEYAAVFQSKIFASGHLFAELPPSAVKWLIFPEFNGAFLVASQETGRAVEAYWPGFALLLAPFEFLGVPWLCNASLAGLAIYLIYRITFEITGDRRAAGWAVLFTVASGVFAAYAISYYSMQAHLTANLLFVWLLLKPTPYRAFAAGVVGSIALVLHNPFPHLLFAAPWIIAIARSKEQRRAFFALILGYLPLTIFIGAGWLHLRGFITSGNSGFNVISNNIHTVFSLPDKSMIDMRVAEMVKMWVWAVPGLFLFAVLGRLRRGDDRRVRLLAQSAVVTFVGYVFFIYDQGHGWGYRYFHSAWGVIPILAACAMTGKSEGDFRLLSFAGSVCILSLLLILPLQMHQIEHIVSRHLEQLPPPKRPGNNVYFVNPGGGFYMADMIQIDPRLRSPDLLLVNRRVSSDAELMRRYWPNAVKLRDGKWGEQWYLGSAGREGSPSSDDRSWKIDFAAPNPP